MSVSKAARTLTGRLSFQPVIKLGFRKDGSPGVTMHVNYEAYGCYDHPDTLRELIADLEVAIKHLESE